APPRPSPAPAGAAALTPAPARPPHSRGRPSPPPPPTGCAAVAARPASSPAPASPTTRIAFMQRRKGLPRFHGGGGPRDGPPRRRAGLSYPPAAHPGPPVGPRRASPLRHGGLRAVSPSRTTAAPPPAPAPAPSRPRPRRCRL